MSKIIVITVQKENTGKFRVVNLKNAALVHYIKGAFKAEFGVDDKMDLSELKELCLDRNYEVNVKGLLKD